jgi:hypothetical protein
MIDIKIKEREILLFRVGAIGWARRWIECTCRLLQTKSCHEESRGINLGFFIATSSRNPTKDLG